MSISIDLTPIPLNIEPSPVPLRRDAGGVVRVGPTRVTLDTVIFAYQDGADAEEIVRRYPSLALADVYSVLGYYLRHKPDIEEYLRQREQQAAIIRKQIEARFDQTGIRERLLARRERQQQQS